MSALEQEIIEKFYLLEPAARQRVLATLSPGAENVFDEAAWWARVAALQAGIRARLGTESAGVLALLDELREEAP
ncbi:MAG: hypothetical protein MUE40_13785 [Anaerolineae bacterium]|jgi:hypothetical protein|nr:hypothetical protein [Anaerolineae bacterium]